MSNCLTRKKVVKSSCIGRVLGIDCRGMKTKLLIILGVCLTISGLKAWDGGYGGYYGGGYNPAPCVQSVAMGSYYQSGGYGAYWRGTGCWRGGYGGYGYGGYANCTPWGNGTGAILNGVAAIVGAAAPILAPPQQQVIYRNGY